MPLLPVSCIEHLVCRQQQSGKQAGVRCTSPTYVSPHRVARLALHRPVQCPDLQPAVKRLRGLVDVEGQAHLRAQLCVGVAGLE
jgi:hypothetical protein